MEQKYIRNFSIIAHIDAGKSTLADRFLEITNTISPSQSRPQLLDSNPIERERGITIKLAPVTMNYTYQNTKYTLNLIDTPGHVDFNYEVERALQACEATILLIDATKGVQAQTISNLKLAQDQHLKIIPAINKTDSSLADIKACTNQLKSLLNLSSQPILISAKTGHNINLLLEQIITSCPPPFVPKHHLTQALIFNSLYHSHLGVIAFVRLFSGQINQNASLQFISSKQKFNPTEIGIFSPHRFPQPTLSPGQVGYLVTNLKDIDTVKIGDTITQSDQITKTSPLPGFREIKPNLYQDLYPTGNTQYKNLIDSLSKLRLNDAALKIQPVMSAILGQGVKVGFLGLLHADVVIERLEREFNLNVIAVSPSVAYKADLKNHQTVIFNSAADFPDPQQVSKTYEPLAAVQIIVPQKYLGATMKLCQNLRGRLNNLTHLDQLVQLDYHFPLIEIVTSLHDQLKSVSSGYASLDYQLIGWQPANLVNLSVLLNHQEFPPLSTICLKNQSLSKAQEIAKKLKKTIPRQQFEIPIQVVLNNKIIARETVKALRKNVTAKLYGGDRTRRMKLLEKQKKGKKRLKQFGQIQLPQETFLVTLK